MVSTFPAADAETWFGTSPPDLSLITRSKGPDYVYRFLKGFYVDTSKADRHATTWRWTGRRCPPCCPTSRASSAPCSPMPSPATRARWSSASSRSRPGRLNTAQYDGFVRDTVNFLDYVGDPSQVRRRDIGIWVVLFLLVFTGFAWLLKKEYWKDVH